MDRNSGRFDGKVALVTGGSTGIGAATVELVAALGGRVVFCSNDAKGVEAAEKEWRELGHDVTGITADVSNGADMERLAMAAADTYGGIDLLANCAGKRQRGTVDVLSEADWDSAIDVNLKGIYLASKFAIPHMRRRGGGSIVNVSSSQSFLVRPNVPAYAASKGGINAMTRSMALDHAKDLIRVNAVCPGLVDTPLVRSGLGVTDDRPLMEIIPDRIAAHPLGAALGRACTAAEVADLIIFLLSEQSSYITGAVHMIDGGLSIQAWG